MPGDASSMRVATASCSNTDTEIYWEEAGVHRKSESTRRSRVYLKADASFALEYTGKI